MSNVSSAAPSEEPDGDATDSTGKGTERRSPHPRTTDSIWQLVHDAGEGDMEAAGRLCVIYREAILAYVRRWTRNVHDAEDLTQTFIARILEKNLFDGFKRRETKFRSFLLRCLGNFLRDDKRVKRPESEPLADETPAAEAAASSLDLALALEIHLRTMRQLAESYAAKGMSDRFAALQPFILGADDRYADLAGPLKMTAGNLRKFVFGLREGYHDGFREAVSQLVTREEIVGEMRYLLGLLAQVPPENRDQKPDSNNPR